MKGQAVPTLFFQCLTLEDGTDKLSRNVGKQRTNVRCVNSRRAKASVKRMFITASLALYEELFPESARYVRPETGQTV
jgi:hypothetical protein